MYDEHENEFGVFWIENHILLFQFKTGVSIDFPAAQQIIADRIKIQNEKPYPILCNIEGLVNVNKAARDYFANQGSVMTNAVGIVANQNSFSFLMAMFYIRVSKPRVPTKVFADKTMALQFLKTFI
jgi:hypothetical protein